VREKERERKRQRKRERKRERERDREREEERARERESMGRLAVARNAEISNIQPIAFGVSFNLNLQSQSDWSLFNETWQKET